MSLLAFFERQSKWDELRRLGNSRLVKLTILVPLIGYMILFNDELLKYLELSSPYFHDVFLRGRLASDGGGLSLSLAYRLYLFYFGFTTLAAGALIYEFCCPRLVHEYGSAAEYVRIEATTTDKVRLDGLAIPMLVEKYHRECAAAGVSVLDVWMRLAKPRDQAHGNQIGQLFVTMANDVYPRGTGWEGIDYARPNIMREYFVPLKTLRPVARWAAFVCYCLGFAILTVPTVHSFISVCATAWSKMTS
jgi:hypothetical protein